MEGDSKVEGCCCLIVLPVMDSAVVNQLGQSLYVLWVFFVYRRVTIHPFCKFPGSIKRMPDFAGVRNAVIDSRIAQGYEQSADVEEHQEKAEAEDDEGGCLVGQDGFPEGAIGGEEMGDQEDDKPKGCGKELGITRT